jgi:hypothetical protein
LALGVHRHEQHARPGAFGQDRPAVLGLCQLGERGRADVGAEGETDEDHGPVAAQFAGQQLGAVGLLQGEVRQHARRGHQSHRFQRRGRGRRRVAVEDVLGRHQAGTGRQGDEQDEQGGAVEHRGRFL